MTLRGFILVFFVLATVPMSVYAQKSKVKGGTSAQDSASAAQARASEANQEARDNLKGQLGMPATSAVDTFAPAPESDPAFSFLQAGDFADAHKRIAQADADLERAAAALVRASQSGKYSDAQLEKAAERIRLQTESLEIIKQRIAAVEKEWRTVKRIPEETEKVAPKPVPVPAQPSGGGKGGTKGKAEVGKGK